ncbi:uncharacterized protein LOC111035494 [Myzus persicae]|uniref:uncharacterized protein LOC111035494 n=1 Tax=Myzus persicae TaxID=13164 RepID=UPI000B937BCF|nr:uncharacterized protein LOC111035494 [Myzus persicae]
MGGSSYIALPDDMKNKKAIINPQNSDQQCFKWAILARHVSGNAKNQVAENYTSLEDKYNFSDITFPTPVREIKTFEKNNPKISVNVYGLKKEKNKKHIVYAIKMTCNFCKCIFSDKNQKDPDHCHPSDKSGQTLCNNCNMKLQKCNFVPCFLHNLSN